MGGSEIACRAGERGLARGYRPYDGGDRAEDAIVRRVILVGALAENAVGYFLGQASAGDQ